MTLSLYLTPSHRLNYLTLSLTISAYSVVPVSRAQLPGPVLHVPWTMLIDAASSTLLALTALLPVLTDAATSTLLLPRWPVLRMSLAVAPSLPGQQRHSVN